MLTMKEKIEQFNLRLNHEQKQRVARLARAAGLSVNEYIARLIDTQFESVDTNKLALLEELQQELINPQPLKKVAAKR